jgi:protein SCO1/2
MPIRFHLLLASALLLACIAVAGPARAEELPAELVGVGVDEKLGQQVDLNLPFTNQDGRQIRLADVIKGDVPVLVTMNYHGCPMLCGIQLNFLRDALSGLRWAPGENFRVVTVSFDPSETSTLAKAKQKNYLESLGRGDVDWQFLTGSAESIRALTDQLGYRYRYVEDSKEYAHPAVIMFLSPGGMVARYIYGLSYFPRDVKFALMEASQGRVGSSVDKLIMSCFHYDPAKGSYVPFAWGIMRLGAILAVLTLGSAIFLLRRGEKKLTAATA